MDEFTRWWMLLSKVPYMGKEEIARKAFFAGQVAEREACIEDVRTVGGKFSTECEALMLKRSNARNNRLPIGSPVD